MWFERWLKVVLYDHYVRVGQPVGVVDGLQTILTVLNALLCIQQTIDHNIYRLHNLAI